MSTFQLNDIGTDLFYYIIQYRVRRRRVCISKYHILYVHNNIMYRYLRNVPEPPLRK